MREPMARFLFRGWKNIPPAGWKTQQSGLHFPQRTQWAILLRQILQLAVLQDARFQLQQVEGWREDLFQGFEVLQLAGIHEPRRIDCLPVGGQLLEAGLLPGT